MITHDEIAHSPVRALWWKQPYASLMLYGKQETRIWNTIYRGLVLICASKAAYSGESVINISGYDQYTRLHKTLDANNDRRLLGHALAIGRLVGVKLMGDYPHIKAEIETKTFVKWYPDLYIHEYEDVTPIEPYLFSGKQGWLTLTPEQKKLIKFQL